MRDTQHILEYFVILTLPVFSLIKMTDTTELFPGPSVYISIWVAGPVPATRKHEYLFPDFKDEALPSISICDYTDKSHHVWGAIKAQHLYCWWQLFTLLLLTLQIDWVFPVPKRKNIPFWLSGHYTSQWNILLPLLTRKNLFSIYYFLFLKYFI